MANNNSSSWWKLRVENENAIPKPLAMVVIQAISMAVMMVVGTLANGAICHCILKHISLRTVTNIFIMNLAATDFLLCVLCMPFAFISCLLDRWIFGDLMCNLTGFLLSLLCVTSILTLVLVAIDRYLAIKRPLKYCALLTNSTSTIMLATVWIYAACCSLLPVLGWGAGYAYNKQESICRPEFGSPQKDNGYTIFLFVSAFAVPFTILATLYLSILWTARKQFRQVHVAKMNIIQVKPQSNTTRTTTNNNQTIGETDNTEVTSVTNNMRVVSNENKRKRRRRNKTRGFKMLLLIVTVFIVCWAPYFILIFYASVAHVKLPLVVKGLTTWLAFLNSSMNPFLYGFLNGKFRSSLKSFLGEKILCCRWLKTHEDSHVFHINH